MKRPSMKLKKSRVSKSQEQRIAKCQQDKRSYIKRRILMGDTLRQAMKRAKGINAPQFTMQDVAQLVSELGLPIASGLIMAYFIFLVMKQLMDGLVGEINTVQAISKMLITRAATMNNDMIRIDTSVSSALNLSPDLERIARAENFVEDGKIDARRD